MAMVDAGFPMKCVVCAVTCTMSESGEIQLDPTLEQEKVRTVGLVVQWFSVRFHSRSLWSAPRIETFGWLQLRKSAIHNLIVKSGKSDWLKIQHEPSLHP